MIDWPLLFIGLALAFFALFQLAGGRVARLIERAALAVFFLCAAVAAAGLAGIAWLLQ